MYVFNGKRFSLRAAVNQQEWQRYSSGSFMLGAAVFARYIHNYGNSILPPYLTNTDFFDGNKVTDINSYSITVRAGYGYNYVYGNHFFASGTLDAGAGPSYSTVKNEKGERKSGVGLDLSANLRLAAGYNSNKWITGVYAILHTDRFSLPYEQSAMSTSQGIFRLFVARRITTRKKILQSAH